MADKRVLFVLTSNDALGDTGKPTGYHLAEVSHPYYVLAEAGCIIEFASPKGGPVPMDPGSRDESDPVNKRFLEDQIAQNKMGGTLSADQIDPERYDAVYFPGGHGTMWDLPENVALAEVTRTINAGGGVISAVCHGPAALVNVKNDDGSHLVAGRKVSAFTDSEERAAELDGVVPFLLASTLAERGAVLEAADDFEKSVSVDGNLVTGQNPASAQEVGERVRDLIGAHAAA